MSLLKKAFWSAPNGSGTWLRDSEVLSKSKHQKSHVTEENEGYSKGSLIFNKSFNYFFFHCVNITRGNPNPCLLVCPFQKKKLQRIIFLPCDNGVQLKFSKTCLWSDCNNFSKWLYKLKYLLCVEHQGKTDCSSFTRKGQQTQMKMQKHQLFPFTNHI